MRTGERLLDRTPIVRGIYGTLKQLFETVLSQTSRTFREVVLIEYPRAGIWSVAFVTGEPTADIARCHDGELVSVFVPTTPIPAYGFLMFVPREQAVRLEMSVEDGMKLVISGGIVMPPERPPPVARGHAQPAAEQPHGVMTLEQVQERRVAPRRAHRRGSASPAAHARPRLGPGEQVLMVLEIGEPEAGRAALAEPQHLARATQAQVFLGDREAVLGRAQQRQPRARRRPQRRMRTAAGRRPAARRGRPGRAAGAVARARTARHARSR